VPLAIGARIGPYEITGSLGAGGMGEVYRARDSRLDREVAVKVLRTGTASPQASGRFEREAKAIAALNHPNICSIYDVGTSPMPFLVMELLDGESLHQRLSRGPLDVATLVDTGLALADALAAAHARGIVHRDLKPANIVLTPHGPKILDFGLARVVEGTTSPDVVATAVPTLPVAAPLTDAGVAVGTVAYMSPEQLRGEALDARTDIFSLGLVLYEMATGQRAFAGGTSAVVSAAILHEQPRAPRSLRPDLPARLDQAILTALEKDRDTRTQTATELRAELKRLKRELVGTRPPAPAPSVQAAPFDDSPDRREPAAASAVGPPPGSSDAQLIAGVLGRHRRALAGAAAVVVLVGVAWFLNRQAGTDPSRETALSIADLDIDQLTTTGTAGTPAISPDGAYVAYVEYGSGAASLWLRQVATESNIPIVEPTPGVVLAGPNFTPDGVFVDYLRLVSQAPPELWRVPTIGARQPRRLSDIASQPGWSPDGRKMAYVRQPTPGRSELVTANYDGGAPGVVAARDAPLRYLSLVNYFSGPAWSPDGSTIALVGTRLDNGFETGQVVFVDVSTRTERTVVPAPAPGVASPLAWLDAETLLFSMLDKPSALIQLWTLSYPGGKFTRLTNDTSQYIGLSLTAGRGEAVTQKYEASFGIWTNEDGGAWSQRVPTSPAKTNLGFGVQWIGDDLLFVPGTGSGMGVARWRASTGKPEMLAPSGGLPSVSRDGSTIAYFDYDTRELWRMDGRGGNRVRLERGTNNLAITPDGRHVVVADVQSDVVKLLRTDGTGIAQDVTRGRVRGRAEVSPDEQRVAFEAFDEQNRPIIAVCDLPDCPMRQTLPPHVTWHWMPDSRALAYVDELTSNLWSQSIDGGTPKQIITAFPDDGLEIWDFSWSATGKLAVARGRISRNIVLFRGLQPTK
jgi:Tol biopolymer transport system component